MNQEKVKGRGIVREEHLGSGTGKRQRGREEWNTGRNARVLTARESGEGGEEEREMKEDDKEKDEGK